MPLKLDLTDYNDRPLEHKVNRAQCWNSTSDTVDLGLIVGLA